MSLARRAVVHIGLPKTGTTAFQHELEMSAPTLLGLGVRVMRDHDGPSRDFGNSRAFHLANAVIRRDLDSWMLSYLPEASLDSFHDFGRRAIGRQVLAPEELLVASVEDLCLIRTPEEVNRLAELLSPRSVSVVLVLRDRQDYQRSLRNQLQRARIRTFSEWPDSCRNLADDSWLFDFEGLISTLTGVLGQESVTVVDYDTVVPRDGSIVPELWRACGLPSVKHGAEAPHGEWLNNTDAEEISLLDEIAASDDVTWLRDRAALELRRRLVMQNSLSWRLTAPLRKARNALRT